MDCSEELGSLMVYVQGSFSVAETAFLVLAEIQKNPHKGGVFLASSTACPQGQWLPGLRSGSPGGV